MGQELGQELGQEDLLDEEICTLKVDLKVKLLLRIRVQEYLEVDDRSVADDFSNHQLRGFIKITNFEAIWTLLLNKGKSPK